MSSDPKERTADEAPHAAAAGGEPPPPPAAREDDAPEDLAQVFVGPMTEKYRLGPLLGEGGFASVFAARHAQIPSLRLAVKLLRREHAENPDVRERFASEARTAAALHGPNVVRVMDVGETASGLPFMVMEYVNGAPLDRLLDRCGSLRTLSVARLALGILEALEEAHGLGVIHRDLKPANILVASQPGHEHPIARVLDFGIAKVLDTHAEGLIASKATVGSHVLCTPQYAAPEVLRGHAVFASDLYALGHLLAEMLDGQPPYADGSPFEVAARQLESTAVPLGPAAQASPLAPVLVRACAKRVEDRYASASEMKADLLAILRELPSRATPRRTPTQRPPRAAPAEVRPAPAPAAEAHEPPGEEPHQSPQTIGAIAEALDPAPEAGDAAPTATGAHSAARAQRIARRAQTGAEGRARAHTVLVRPDLIEQAHAGSAPPAGAIEELPPPRGAQADLLPVMDSELHYGANRPAARWMLGAAIAVALALLAWTAVRWAASGDAPPRRLSDALVAARAGVHEAAAVTGPHSFTFTSNVDGGEVWFEGRPVGALPRFHVFGPATRPVTVEFRHPDFRTVEVTHTAPDAVSIRAPFSRPARRSRPQR